MSKDRHNEDHKQGFARANVVTLAVVLILLIAIAVHLLRKAAQSNRNYHSIRLRNLACGIVHGEV